MVSIDSILVNFTQQIFNDALNSLEKAKNLDKNKTPFEYWKYSTWSIVASAIAMESYLSEHINTIKDDMDQPLWKSYEKESFRIAKSRGIYSKIKFIELITDSKIIDETDNDWINISNIISLRNDIVHYRKIGIFNSITDINAENGIKACRDLVKKLHGIIFDSTTFPSWMDKKQSENYDIPKP
jgi:hypothetical protein